MKATKLIIASLTITVLVLLTLTLNGVSETGDETAQPGSKYIPKDTKTDNLLTEHNTILLVIDWQEEMLGMVRNIDLHIGN